jgi:hypothetical protein
MRPARQTVKEKEMDTGYNPGFERVTCNESYIIDVTLSKQR